MAARAVDPRYRERMDSFLARGTAAFSRVRAPRPGLHSGLSGAGWTSAHLAARHPHLDVEELCEVVDEALEESLRQSPWPHPCDLRDGLAGIGLYALERRAHPAGRRLLGRAG